jgi:hypothetical protein
LPPLLVKYKNNKKNLHQNLGIFIEDIETSTDCGKVYYLGKNYNVAGNVEKSSEFIDGFTEGVSQNNFDDTDADLGYGAFYSDLKKS